MSEFLTVADVHRLVERLGFVVRDPDLLDSAVMRAQHSVGGRDAYPDLWAQAAALCQSLDGNQALVDGNKRLAWICTKLFLGINGWHLAADDKDGEQFMLDLVAGHAPLNEIAGWLRAHSSPSDQPGC